MNKKILNISDELLQKKLKEFREYQKENKILVKEISSEELAGKIDHTILKPEAINEEIEKLCYEAKEFGFASVCVNPSFVSLCAELLKGTEVKVCTVIGFPLGATTTGVKIIEAEEAIANGAAEVDMVINIGQLKIKNYQYVFNDISEIVSAAKEKALTKVIIETALLTDEEKIAACLICKEAGADFVKTSTGFSKSGATTDDVSLMKFIVGDEMKVKASGGIRTREDALNMIAYGADRIGASAGIKIIKNEKSKENY